MVGVVVFPIFEYAVEKILNVLEMPIETTAFQARSIGQGHDLDPVNTAFTQNLKSCVQPYLTVGLMLMQFRSHHRQLY